MASRARVNFVHQQGFRDAPADSCGTSYSALLFQPRVLGVLVLVALVLQSAPLFLALSALLWWNVVVPRWNPFDAVYNGLLAGRSGRARLTPAPAPRRFAQGMAASFMLAIGAALAARWAVTARVLEALLVVALSALVFGKFCLGSYIYHLLRGEASFANRTLPWSRS